MTAQPPPWPGSSSASRGGIAAYKAVELLRALTEAGHDVTVVPTERRCSFVGAPTWAALSHHPVDDRRLDRRRTRCRTCGSGREADLVVVAPATADLLARAAHGLADDLLTNTLLTARCPVLFAPAMHTEMWEHPATGRERGHAAPARRDRARAGDRAADRRRHRPGPAARPGRDRRAGRAAAARAVALPADLVGRARPDQRRRHPRAARPGALPRQRVLRPAGLRARHGRRRPRRRRSRWSRPTSSCPTRPAAEVVRVEQRRRAARGRAQGRRRRRRRS